MVTVNKNKMLGFLTHNALVTLGTSRLPNCMVVNSIYDYQVGDLRSAKVPVLTCMRARYIHVFYDVYHAGNTVRGARGGGGGGGGGGDCIPYRELSPVN